MTKISTHRFINLNKVCIATLREIMSKIFTQKKVHLSDKIKYQNIGKTLLHKVILHKILVDIIQ